MYLKIFLAWFFFKIGFLKKLIQEKQIILSYHNIISDKFYENIPHLGVSHSETVFKKQIKIINYFLKKYNIDQKLFLTFDDGFRNNYTLAKDYLKSLNVKCIFFISPVKRKGDEMFWIDKLLYVSSYLEEGNYEIFGESVNLKNEERFNFQSELLKKIYKNYNKKNDIINLFFLKAAKLNHDCLPKTLYYNQRFNFMTEEEIEEISRLKNFYIGYHTIHHDNLSLVSKKDFAEELKNQNHFIKKYGVKDFAFPFGAKEEISIKHLNTIKKAGMLNIYSNTENFIVEEIIPRRSIPNVTNKYLVLAYYSNLFGYLKNLLFLKK